MSSLLPIWIPCERGVEPARLGRSAIKKIVQDHLAQSQWEVKGLQTCSSCNFLVLQLWGLFLKALCPYYSEPFKIKPQRTPQQPALFHFKLKQEKQCTL